MAGGGNAIKGSRVGAGQPGESDRGHAAPRQQAEYWCTNRHRTPLTFAAGVEVPPTWDCPKCGLPSSTDPDNVPDSPRTEVYKTHLAYAKERRSDAEAEALLDEALTVLRSRRRSGEISG